MRAMGLASLFTAIGAFLLMIGGALLAIVPILGVTMSWSAPLVALVAVVLGGIAMSRAKRDGEPAGVAVAGLTLGIVVFLLGLLLAVTCGLCGALVSNAYLNGDLDRSRNGRNGMHMRVSLPDGGMMEIDPFAAPPSPAQPPPPSGTPVDPSAAPEPTPEAPPSAAPPPAMPPPPLGAAGEAAGS